MTSINDQEIWSIQFSIFPILWKVKAKREEIRYLLSILRSSHLGSTKNNENVIWKVLAKSAELIEMSFNTQRGEDCYRLMVVGEIAQVVRETTWSGMGDWV